MRKGLNEEFLRFKISVVTCCFCYNTFLKKYSKNEAIIGRTLIFIQVLSLM